MVATLLSLRLLLLRRTLQHRPVVVVLTACVAPFLLLTLVGTTLATWQLGQGIHRDGAAETALLGLASAELMLVLLALLLGATSTDLDPSRFATLPVDARRLRPALLTAALTGPLGLAALLLGAHLVLVWHARPTIAAAAVPAALAGALAVVLLQQALTAAFARALQARRFREVSAALLALSTVALGLVPAALDHVLGRGGLDRPGAPVRTVAQVLGWTPVGWAWALPADVAAGRPVSALCRGLLVACLVVVLWLWWGRSLDAALTTPPAADGGRSTTGAGGLAGALAGLGAAGAVAARELRMWRRDPRRWQQTIALLMMPLFLSFSFLDTSRPVAYALLAGSLAAAGTASGATTHALSYAGDSTWMDLVAGVPGRTERAGVLLAAALVTGPLVLLLGVGALVLDAPHAGLALAVAPTVLLVALSCGLVAGVLTQVRLPPPGSSPFARGQGAGVEAAVIALACMASIPVVSAPVLVCAGLSLTGTLPAAVAVVVSLLEGALVPVAACRVAGGMLDRRWPAVLARLRAPA